MTCRSCIHWQADPVATTGECRAHPPVIVDAIVEVTLRTQRMPSLGEAAMEGTRWPVTRHDDDCGEFHSHIPTC